MTVFIDLQLFHCFQVPHRIISIWIFDYCHHTDDKSGPWIYWSQSERLWKSCGKVFCEVSGDNSLNVILITAAIHAGFPSIVWNEKNIYFLNDEIIRTENEHSTLYIYIGIVLIKGDEFLSGHVHQSY